jgi:hypothetical protein
MAMALININNGNISSIAINGENNVSNEKAIS